MVGVAQLVEPLTVTQVVEGSSPFIHPIVDQNKRHLITLSHALNYCV